jgi:hypothetical protein
MADRALRNVAEKQREIFANAEKKGERLSEEGFRVQVQSLVENGAGGAPELVNIEAAHDEEQEEEAGARPTATDAPVEDVASPKMDMVAFRARQRRLRLLHAALMGVAWLVAAPAGAIVARYFKQLGALWFDAHRLLQGVTVGASLFGGAIALGILHPYLSNLGLHGKLGILVLLLTCAQPVNAYFRPAKTAGQPRVAWKQLHAGLGWATVAGGAFNCFVGVTEMVEKEGIPYIVSSECDLCPHKDLARWERVMRRVLLRHDDLPPDVRARFEKRGG